MMRVLLTGATGKVGSRARGRLVDNHDVRLLVHSEDRATQLRASGFDVVIAV
jgi:nucleoside-diphosphate-sugar epimerase